MCLYAADSFLSLLEAPGLLRYQILSELIVISRVGVSLLSFLDLPRESLHESSRLGVDIRI